MMLVARVHSRVAHLALFSALLVGCSGGGDSNRGGGGAAGSASTGGSHPGVGGGSGGGGDGAGGRGGAGADQPSSPTELLMTKQDATSTTLTWEAATPAGAKIDHYRIYRNGDAYDTTSDLTYIDTKAKDCEISTLDAPGTAYAYAVSAVDADGHEGPPTTQYKVYGYRGAKGGSTWGNSDYSYGLESLDWNDTSGMPVGGGTDIKIVFKDQSGGGFQPYSNMPQVPTYGLELGAFDYLTFDIKAEHADENDFFLSVLSRLPFGDVYCWVDVRVQKYQTLHDGEWATVKIPLADFHLSTSKLTGSIGAPYGMANDLPFATLKVASLDAGSGIDNGGYLLGTGLPGPVYVVANGQNASVGTFQVQGAGIDGSTTLASKKLDYQRSEFYKFDLGLNDGRPGGNVYLNNVAFIRE